MLSQSVKNLDSLKVGQFGIGFKSVFHLTGNSFVLRITCSILQLTFRPFQLQQPSCVSCIRTVTSFV